MRRTLDAVGVFIAVGLFRQEMPPSAVFPLAPFLAVFVAIMKRSKRRLVYVTVEEVSKFAYPTDEFPALRDGENAADDKIDGMVMTRS